jgi:hypothetical protein
MSTEGILLPCDGTEPLPVSVGDNEDLRSMVGGYIDCVSCSFGDDMLETLEAPEDATPFTVCGYINDEGLLDGLPINTMASIVFGRELRGPVVLVSATGPDGDEDGENYDIPVWFSNAVFNGGLHELATLLVKNADIEAQAIRLAVQDGVFTDLQLVELSEWMESDDPAHIEKIEVAISVALVYAMGRATGKISKFDREAYENWVAEFEGASPHLSDDEIAKFWEQEGL